MLNIVLGADHGGFEYKTQIKSYLLKKGYNVFDVGTFSTDSCHYPIFAKKAADMVKEGKADFGVLICSSGEGVSIAANKVEGIRCGIGYSDEASKFMRLHNNANMIAFGAKYMELKDVLKRIDIFLQTEFESGGRHEERVKLIDEIEKNKLD